jgi:hypothetical protein
VVGDGWMDFIVQNTFFFLAGDCLPTRQAQTHNTYSCSYSILHTLVPPPPWGPDSLVSRIQTKEVLAAVTHCGGCNESAVPVQVPDFRQQACRNGKFELVGRSNALSFACQFGHMGGSQIYVG